MPVPKPAAHLKKDLKSTKVCGVFYDFINGNKLCLP
jgi:hypothetical protein